MKILVLKFISIYHRILGYDQKLQEFHKAIDLIKE